MTSRAGLAAVALMAAMLACGEPAPAPVVVASTHTPEFDRAAAELPIRLEDRAGSVSQPVTTSSEKAQDFYDQGVAFLYAYQWILAARSFHVALSEDPNLAMAELGLAKAWSGAQNYSEAEARLAAAESLAERVELSEKERRWIELGRQQFAGARLGEDERPRALERYRSAIDKLIALDSHDPHAWVLRGNAEEGAFWGRGQGGREESIAYYVAALRNDPAHAGAHHFLVHTYENLDRLDEAAIHGVALTTLAAGAPHPLHMYAHVLPRLDRWQEARKWLEEADRLHRSSISTESVAPADDWHYSHNLHLLGLVELSMGDETAGAAHLREAYDIEARGAFAGFHRGPWIEYLLWRGRFDEALAEAMATEELGFPMARVIGTSLAGEAHLAMGDVAAARRALVRALAAANGIGEDQRGNLFEHVLPYVAWRYTHHLELLLGLVDGVSAEGESELLEQAGGTMTSRSIDVWAAGRMRVEATAAQAARLGHGELAERLQGVATR